MVGVGGPSVGVGMVAGAERVKGWGEGLSVAMVGGPEQVKGVAG